MKQFRLNRLFNAKSNRCFDVAVDHGFFNQPGFLAGLENIAKTVQTLVAAGPDAIQLTPGQARHLQGVLGHGKPRLVLRTDTANVYGKELPKAAFSAMIEDAMLQAVRLDAACVCVNLFQIPGAPEVTEQCITNILKLKVQSDHYAMPMMVEPLVFRAAEGSGYTVNGDEKVIGISLRNLSDKKSFVKCGQRGLYVPSTFRIAQGPIVIVEGASDTAALVDAQIAVVGRPSAKMGTDALARLLRADAREIIVLGENDKKNDDLWPGRDGAIHVANELATRLGRPVKWALPPKQYKDAREYLISEKGHDS